MSAPDRCAACGRPLGFGPAERPLSARSEPAQPLPFAPPPRSPIVRDRELAAFIIDLARPGTMILRDIRAACQARFGPSRTPSRSALHRFISALRTGRVKVTAK